MRKLVVASLVVAAGLSACVGSTEPATKVSTVSAQLNAKGFTNDGPATWWWEYDTIKTDLGTANDTEVCGSPPEPDRRCGPAAAGSAGNPISLSVTVTGLTPNTTYYFRACGQDTNDTQPTCASTLSFKTLAGTSYAFDLTWGSNGEGNGQFFGPRSVAIDPAGSNVYVVDASNWRIQKFTSTGIFITKWGSLGTADGQFGSPSGIATDPAGNVYVSDAASNRIQKFSPAGTFLTKWGARGTGDGQFNLPVDVAVDNSGNVYVLDQMNSRVQKFTSTGAFVTKWGSRGSGNGQFHDGVYGLGTDPAGNVYVGDGGNFRIQKFSSTGTFITKWGSVGAGPGQFGVASDVATDSAGDVYVADAIEPNIPILNARIQKFSSTGAFITQWGSLGSGNGELYQPLWVAVDRYGGVYVVDANNARIQKFKPVQ